MLMTKEFIKNNLLSIKGSIISKSLKKYKVEETIEELYIIYNNISNVKCNNNKCHNKPRFNNFSKGYSEYCSVKCAKSDIKQKDKVKASNIEKYGVSSPMKLSCVVEKGKKTKLKKYGDKNFNNRSKMKETKLRNHGDENYINIAKAKATNIEKHGVECTLLSKSSRAKTTKTNIEKYGFSHHMKNPYYANQAKARLNNEETIKKRSETNIKRYGVLFPLENKDIRLKIKETLLERYGVEYISQSKKYKEIMISKGYHIPDTMLIDCEIYYKKVKQFTNRNKLELLPNFYKRGISGKENAFQLDHKFSIMEGFMQNIPPYIIGNIANLEMLPWRKNIKKSKKCSITIDEILRNISEQL